MPRGAASSTTTATAGYHPQGDTRAHCPLDTVDSSIIYPGDPYDVQAIVDYLKTVKEFSSTYTPPGGAKTDRKEIRFLPTAEFPEENRGVVRSEYGTQVASKAYGVLLGLAKNAELVVVNNLNCDPEDKFNYIHERYLASLVAVLDDVLEHYPENMGKVIVNMSFGWVDHEISYMHSEHWETFRRILKELDDLGAVLVAASHNQYLSCADVRNGLDGWPSRFADPDIPEDQAVRNLIVVSGIDKNSRVSWHNPYASWRAMAPGHRVNVATGSEPKIGISGGASLATAHVVGVIAYWRGLKIPESSGWADELKEPTKVKKLVLYMHRKLDYDDFPISGEHHADLQPREQDDFQAQLGAARSKIVTSLTTIPSRRAGRAGRAARRSGSATRTATERRINLFVHD
ncbi:peptidase S8/S53 domain-containing protein [Dichotomopilus funicola]|uniref:Peptidase S8/S53 domain-containing protein n=1 Tax=Dichotomopilus funicola TaxID=1934379 RepID=A0AAN6V9B8_9PEZI|nr:peptidase S8/S53 domain-containing protein [Dichotomopilus funicola]